MTHPYGDIRQHKVERSRVPAITRGYAAGGAVVSEAPVARKTGGRTGKSLALKMEGGVAKMRADRPGRAKGGRAPKAKTNVNVIIAPQGAAPGMAPVPAKPPGPLPPAMAGPPGMPMPPPGVGGPPGLHARGGRAYASGGGVNAGTKVFEAGRKAGTQVQHSDGKMDSKDSGRGKPVTYATGGPVFARPTGQHGPKYGGGGGGGTERSQAAARAARLYKKA